MGAGQGALASLETLERMRVVELRLECDELDRGAVHAKTLRDVLELNALLVADGMGLAAASQVALSLSCSENRAAQLLVQASGLAELPGALEAVECGLLTVEQSGTVVAQLAVLELPGRLAVWRRLQERLIADADAGVVSPPARLTERLRKWVIAYDKEAAEQRRRQAEQERRVETRKREDGLWDLFAFGFRGPVLQAILQRIQKLSAPFGVDDDRTADQRRFDALSDLLLGRHDRCSGSVVGEGAGSGAACGCRPGEASPCGMNGQVLIPIGAALKTTDEVAELVGHGPLEPDLLEQMLIAAPLLRAVFVDDDGVPVATSDRVFRPERGDPESVRQTLLAMAQLRPERWYPRHPEDHPDGQLEDHPPPEPKTEPKTEPEAAPEDDARRRPAGGRGGSLRRPQLARSRAPGGMHPPGTPGPYQVPVRLRRLVFTRAPRCEWPGCGARATRCDAEHDTAHPDGPTCACNLGPLCRRHHQVKQLLWTKTRTLTSAVLWTSHTGRQHLSPSQHEPPAPASRALRPLPGPHPLDELSPLQVEHELWSLGLLPDDPDTYELRAPDIEHPDDVDPDPLDPCGQPSDTTWTTDLRDPYLWADPIR